MPDLIARNSTRETLTIAGYLEKKKHNPIDSYAFNQIFSAYVAS
jgi:hypothetical protein